MKKSEMAKIIHNWYWNNYPRFSPLDLLDILESEGMLPPLRVQKSIVERKIKDDDGEIVTGTRQVEYMVNEWDNEDEKK